jgi:pimeloyl-ACP methyl ester carboxylesterase
MTEPSDLTRHDVTADDGTRLRVYEVAPEQPTEAVLCLHGGLTPARALFAPPVGDGTSHSWLHAIADAGRAAYALDVRGYGDSEMLPEYDDAPEANDPPVRAWDAAHDVKATYDFVSDRHDTTHLLGVSWGTMTGGSFLEQYDDRPASFVQCAPVYKSPVDFEAAAAALGLDTDLVAYITEEYDVVKERQGGGEVFEAVWSAIAETNQALDDENAYIAQTGALADTKECCEGNPPYDAAAIDVPTLVVRGTDDHTSQREDALTLYDELDVEGDHTAYAELQGGDHFVMHGHRRHDLYATTNDFFDRV